MCAGRLTTSILVAVVLSIDAAPTFGEEAPARSVVLGLTAPPGQVDLLAPLETALRGAATGSGRVVPAAEELRSIEALSLPREERARIAEARSRSRELYLRFDFGGARDALETARRALLERYADLFCDPELLDVDLELADLLLNLRDQLGGGSEAEAFSMLLEVARCRPDLEPSADVLGPRVLAAWSEVRAHAALPAGADLPPRNIRRLALAGAAAGVESVITASVSRGSQDSISLRLAAIRVDTAEAVAEEEVSIGQRADWERTLRPVLQRLLAAATPAPAHPPAPPESRIFLLTTPAGASVLVDDTLTGETTPATLTVSPGRHRLALRLEGYAPALVDVMAWERQIRPVEVRLRRSRSFLGRRLWWLWTIVSVVGAGAVAGVVVWAVTASGERPDLIVDVVHTQGLVRAAAGSGRR